MDLLRLSKLLFQSKEDEQEEWDGIVALADKERREGMELLAQDERDRESLTLLNVSISSELYERMSKYAKIRNMSITEYIEALVDGDGYARDSLKKLNE